MKQRKRYKNFVQGIYKPVNRSKCLNTTCIYRSSWELKLFEWCDRSSNIVRWSSEKIAIPYESPIDGRVHHYFPDAWIELAQRDGKLAKYLVEIKPAKQTVEPTITKRKKQKTMIYEQSTWAINKAKWASAEQFCKTRGLRFLIVTEHHLNV